MLPRAPPCTAAPSTIALATVAGLGASARPEAAAAAVGTPRAPGRLGAGNCGWWTPAVTPVDGPQAATPMAVARRGQSPEG